VVSLSIGLGEPFVDFIIILVRRKNNLMHAQETEMVFFDAGETLIHPLPSFPDLFTQVCADHQLDVDLSILPKITRSLMAEVEEKQRNGYTFTNDAEVSRHFWLNFYGTLVRGMGYGEDNGVLPDVLYQVFSEPSNYGAYEDVRDSLHKLHELGFRLGLISNFEPWLEDLLHSLGLKEFFEIMVISGHEEFEKPHPRIFEVALERSDISPERALHVGDSPISDFCGANRVGIKAILLDRWGRFPNFEGTRIADLRELPALLS
jgi:putative hydrolase of the HAD superfamily